ncbi:ATP-dependent helicase HrpB [Vibrio maritimus]|uniref:ATP-dependent helicase HrpB n=1 Tax=Vibrio maritimus TaxID=990268 RepID=UPI001F2B7057|nr:ATP-dependent helicase HrpB [Vibrio maritimus]
MSQLPIEHVLPELFEAIRTSDQIILKAATGAGKSTHFPLKLVLSGIISGKVVMLEPRRIAARNIAMYVAAQLGEPVGKQVGYRVRGESKVSASTKLEVVTEGILTRMLQDDPELTGIDMIIFDEFHERSLHADTALAFALESQEALREDLKIVVMSATLDPDDLVRVLPTAQFIQSEGRSYPVDIDYQPMSQNDYLPDFMAKQVERLLIRESGSLLAFLPGVGAIKRVQELLQKANLDATVCPLYGQLDFATQQAAIQPAKAGERKVVLATNIAETSLTIEGIRLVVDSGLENQAWFDLKTGISKLEQGRIAQSSAIQRAGRAGRTEPGLCVRLYSESQFQAQPEQSTPEILRSDLASLQLELIRWGCHEASELAWIDEPKFTHLEQAKSLLIALKLIDETGKATALGNEAYQLGVEPRMASMLLQANLIDEQALKSAVALCALIEEPERNEVDLRQSLHRWQQARHPRNNALKQRAKTLSSRFSCRFNVNEVDESLLGVVAALAFPDRIALARKQSGLYVLANGHGASVDQQHRLSDEAMLVVVDLMRTGQGSSAIFKAAPITFEQINTLLPEMVDEATLVEWDDNKGRVVASEQRRIGSLVVESRETTVPEDADISQALLSYVRRRGLSVLSWTDKAEELTQRVQCAALWLENDKWPAMSSKDLLANLDEWLLPFMHGVTNAKQLKKVDVVAALEALLGWEKAKQLDEWLPTHLTVASGNRKKIRYQVGEAPTLSVKLQEMFGEKVSPTIAKGTQPIVLELLSPAQRPLQITRDLAAFWQGAYKQVQKEMKGRYPKHPWPDDPMNHQATSKTKRQLDS